MDVKIGTSLKVNNKDVLTEHQSLSAYRTSAEQDVIDNGKQETLIAGDNITITNNVISSIIGIKVKKVSSYEELYNFLGEIYNQITPIFLDASEVRQDLIGYMMTVRGGGPCRGFTLHSFTTGYGYEAVKYYEMRGAGLSMEVNLCLPSNYHLDSSKTYEVTSTNGTVAWTEKTGGGITETESETLLLKSNSGTDWSPDTLDGFENYTNSDSTTYSVKLLTTKIGSRADVLCTINLFGKTGMTSKLWYGFKLPVKIANNFSHQDTSSIYHVTFTDIGNQCVDTASDFVYRICYFNNECYLSFASRGGIDTGASWGYARYGVSIKISGKVITE